MNLLVAVAVSVLISPQKVEAFLGCEEKFAFETRTVDVALKRFYAETGGPTEWPSQFRGFWDSSVPCAWDGNERAHPAPAGSRCVNGGYHRLPPAGDGGLMFLEHASGFARGPIPPEFMSFQMADFIGLSHNRLEGPLWNTSMHCFLHRLDVSHNALSGTLPPDFLQRAGVHMGILRLAHNALSGPLPPTLPTLRVLTSLLLEGNAFTGSIPDLSPCTQLRHLNVSRNRLEGPLAFLRELPNLAWVDVSHNLFKGTLPELPDSVVHFDGSGNGFVGELPQSYGRLGGLRYFRCVGCDIKCPSEGFLDHVYESSHCRRPRAWEK